MEEPLRERHNFVRKNVIKIYALSIAKNEKRA